MASPKLCAGLNAGDLPLDATYEILQRLPAKALCRLRAVCRFWRSLLSDPEFAAAHAARRREPPLIILGYNCNTFEGEDDSTHVNRCNPGSLFKIMDLSGHTVKQVRIHGHRVMGLPVNLACVREIANGSCRLLDPSTAAMRYHAKDNLGEGEHPFDCDYGLHLFGQVASTREHKAFRKVAPSHVGEYGLLYEVCTLSSGSRPRWRPVQGPPNTFGCDESASVVIDGVAYFLVAEVCLSVMRRIPVIQRDWIYSFDLDTERWRPNIKGPQGFSLDGSVGPSRRRRQMQLSLANLNGSLAIVHGPAPNMDIWFLMDFEKSHWVKQYSIHIQRSFLSYFLPLIVLDDGRIVIVIHVGSVQSLEIHDPRTNTFSIVAEMSHCRAINVYTGNLLSLEWWQPTNNEKEEKEKVTHDGGKRAQKVSKDALDLKPGWMAGVCQIKSLCSCLADALLSVIFGKSRD